MKKKVISKITKNENKNLFDGFPPIKNILKILKENYPNKISGCWDMNRGAIRMNRWNFFESWQDKAKWIYASKKENQLSDRIHKLPNSEFKHSFEKLLKLKTLNAVKFSYITKFYEFMMKSVNVGEKFAYINHAFDIVYVDELVIKEAYEKMDEDYSISKDQLSWKVHIRELVFRWFRSSEDDSKQT